MGFQNRRNFLKLCAASVPALALANAVDADEKKSRSAAPPAYRTPGSMEPYIDPLPIPKKLMPYRTGRDRIEYRIRMLEFRQQMHSQLPPTKLWGYEGQYPGPTIEAMQGRPIEVRWENHLPSQPYFEIDPHIHGAMPPAPAVRTVPHLHGSRTRSESDGLPEKWFTPGSFGALSVSEQPAGRDTLVSRSCAGYYALECICGLVGILSAAR